MRKLSSSIVLFALLAVLTACSAPAPGEGGGSPAPQEPEVSAFVWPASWSVSDAAQVKRGGTLQIAGAFAVGPNPIQRNAIATELRSFLSDGAAPLRFDPETGDWRNYAADVSFSADSDGPGGTAEVVLREGMRWSDGAPITARDYVLVKTFETAAGLNETPDADWQELEITVHDDRHLTYYFPELSRVSLSLLARPPYPDHRLGKIYREGGAEALYDAWGFNDDPQEMAWSGPWTYAGRNEDFTEIHLLANPHFGTWNHDTAGNALPYLDELILRNTGEADIVQAFVEGSIDYITVQAARIAEVLTEDPAAVISGSTGYEATSRQLVFNWNLASDPFLQELFRSSKFRRAMSHLLDRGELIEELHGGAGGVMWTPVSLNQSHWLEEAAARFEYAPAEARRLLGELGFSEDADGLLVDGSGNHLEFELLRAQKGPEYDGLAEHFRKQAAAIGITVTEISPSFADAISLVVSQGDDRGFHAVLAGRRGGSSAWPFHPLQYGCEPPTKLWNSSDSCLAPWEEEVADLAWQGHRELDDAEAREIAGRIQRLTAEHQPVIYLPVAAVSYAWKPFVRGEYPDGLVGAAEAGRSYVLTWLSE